MSTLLRTNTYAVLAAFALVLASCSAPTSRLVKTTTTIELASGEEFLDFELDSRGVATRPERAQPRRKRVPVAAFDRQKVAVVPMPPPAAKIPEVYTLEQRLRAGVVRATEAYLGLPYVWGAKGPDRFDCSGLTSHVLAAFDVELTGNSTSQSQQGVPVKVKDAEAGDIVFFKAPSGRVNHVALVVANTHAGLEVVHATSRGVVRDNITHSRYWAPRLAGARRLTAGDIGGVAMAN